MVVNLIELNMLNNLFRSTNGLDEVTLFKRQRISFSVFSKSSALLEERGLVQFDNHIYKITSDGRKELLGNRYRLGSQYEKPWRQIPEFFKGESIDISKVYMPYLSKLDRCFFE